MIPKNLSLVPFNPIQQAASLAIAEVELKIKNGKKLSENPYATAFFLKHFGKRTPTKDQIKSIQSGDSSVKEKTSIINHFLAGNGSFLGRIERSFAYKCFPALKAMNEERFKASCNLKNTQSEKVKLKINERNACFKDGLIKELMSLDCLNISSWVTDTEIHFSNYEQVNALSDWFDVHCQHYNDSFSDLYYGMTAFEIAVDLSYGLEV